MSEGKLLGKIVSIDVIAGCMLSRFVIVHRANFLPFAVVVGVRIRLAFDP